MKKRTLKRLTNILVMTVLILLITFEFGVKPVYATTFTFSTVGSGSSGTITYGTPSTATWTENGYTFNLSFAGAKEGEIYNPVDSMNNIGIDGWTATNSLALTTIAVTISINGGYVFDLNGLNVYDGIYNTSAPQNTYMLTTSKGGIEGGVLDPDGVATQQPTCSGPQFQGISSFTISVTANSGNQTGINFSDLIVSNIIQVTSAPTIIGINPTSGPSGTNVVITGSDFSTVQGADGVKFGNVNAASYTVDSAT